MTRRTGSRQTDRLAAGIRQAAEYALAVALVGFSLHAGDGAPLLVVAAVTVALWAAISDAPMAGIHFVGRRLHRAGVLAEALLLAALPFAAGRVGDLSVSGPSLFAAIMLFQLAITRRSKAPLRLPGPEADPRPDQHAAGQAVAALTSLRSAEADPHPQSSPAPVSPARLAGQLSGRVATVVSKQAEVTVPAGVRRVGRLAGRLNARRRG